MRAVVPWVTRGLLWGRLIVPDLSWVWGIAIFFLIVSLAINLILHEPVSACADTLGAKAIVERLKAYESLGERFKPTKMLLEHAKSGKKFYDA